MYIRRDALNEVGLFDSEAFPRGYGEENDWCMRARQKGWKHLFDPSVFVYHHRSASFGEEKHELMAQGRKVVDERYPEYKQLVTECFGSPQFTELRNKVRTLANMPEEVAKTIRPRVLTVISTRTGGTPQTNEDMMSAISEQFESFVLHCDGSIITLYSYHQQVYTEVENHLLSEVVTPFPHASAEYDDVVAGWLYKWAIEVVHIRHTAWHSLGLPAVAKALYIPVVNSFHDFYTVCPTVKLLDENLTYCGGVCTKGTGQCAHELWPQDAIVNLKHENIHVWREQFSAFLSSCDAFVTTNHSAKALIQKAFPKATEARPFEVIPHGRDFENFSQLVINPAKTDVVKVLVPGNISEAKGGMLLEQLSKYYGEQGTPIEFHIMGNVGGDLQFSQNVVCHGPYARGQFSQKVEEVGPSLGLVLSIWPETWCHTLTEMWAAGVPVLGLDIGAVGVRIAQTGAGWLAPVDDFEFLVSVLDSALNESAWTRATQAVKHWQQTEGTVQTAEAMGEAYKALYYQVAPGTQPQKTLQVPQ
ncbi:predicted glycosyltransferase [Reinekea sp. MED297]|uniref:Predicted glycosyltransferase n=2 Tax=Reinekea TaxID=230494 RepID=A4BIY8_9GAMM|nr:predicted glycosyltransferase [Reinekea sp. MED297] [Reinekea blandensis MED297]